MKQCVRKTLLISYATYLCQEEQQAKTYFDGDCEGKNDIGDKNATEGPSVDVGEDDDEAKGGELAIASLTSSGTNDGGDENAIEGPSVDVGEDDDEAKGGELAIASLTSSGTNDGGDENATEGPGVRNDGIGGRSSPGLQRPSASLTSSSAVSTFRNRTK
mmetsp:Transcript_27346/g.62782  ORF Transcript_27346/g.62782 Transcript_27346/m.62782 type:complete len:160 (+) Transcript_27346:808-1287(+)